MSTEMNKARELVGLCDKVIEEGRALLISVMKKYNKSFVDIQDSGSGVCGITMDVDSEEYSADLITGIFLEEDELFFITDYFDEEDELDIDDAESEQDFLGFADYPALAISVIETLESEQK